MANNIDEKRPWIPRGKYYKLSNAYKVSIWAITISCFVTVFTFWLGLSYQYTIVINKKDESQKAIHYNSVNEIHKYKQLFENLEVNNISRNIYATISSIQDTGFQYNYLLSDMMQNWDSIISNIEKGILISEKAKYYLPEEKFREISFNNSKLVVFLSLEYGIKRDKKKEDILNLFLTINKGDSAFYKELNDSMKTEIGMYNSENKVFLRDYVEVEPHLRKKELQYYCDSMPNGTWVSLESLYYNNHQLSDNELNSISILRYKVYQRLCIFLADNYRAIKDEIEPISKNRKIKNLLSDITSEPGIYMSLISLILIIPVGLLIWWFFIWLIFRNAESSEGVLSEESVKEKTLERELAILSTISKLYINQQRIIRELDNKVDKSFHESNDELLKGNKMAGCSNNKESYYNKPLHHVEIDGRYGYADEKGIIVIPCKWDWAQTPFQGELALVKDSNGKCGFIDKTGKEIIPCQWKSALAFYEGLAAVKSEGNEWGYIDKNNNVLIPFQWRSARIFSEGLAAVQDTKKKWGFIDKTGKIIIPCQWDYVHSTGFKEGVAEVGNSPLSTWLIDKNGKVVGSIN